MNSKTENAMKIGGAMMAVGAAAAIAKRKTKANVSPKAKMKKIAKKSAKVMDGMLDNIQGMMK